jgi:hypothetical protein
VPARPVSGIVADSESYNYRPADAGQVAEEPMSNAAELTGGEMQMWSSGDAPPEVLEQFWENVVAYEETPAVTPLDVLREGGLELPPADQLLHDPEDAVHRRALDAAVDEGLKDAGQPWVARELRKLIVPAG